MDLKDRPTLHIKCSLFNIWFAHLPFDQTFNFDETFIQVLKPSHDGKNAHFCCSFSYLELCSEDSLYFSSAVVATLCQSSATFCKTRVRLKSESLCVCILLQYISVQEQKIEPANISLLRVPRNVSYEQRNKFTVHYSTESLNGWWTFKTRVHWLVRNWRKNFAP